MQKSTISQIQTTNIISLVHLDERSVYEIGQANENTGPIFTNVTKQQIYVIINNVTPVESEEIPGYIYLFIVIFFANVSGMGGGFLTVVILYEVFGFEYRKMLGYTSAINLSVALLRYVYYFRSKHPMKTHHTLIDYEMAMIMMPFGVFGYLVSDVLFGIVPMFFVAVCMGVFWGGVAIEMFLKAIRLFRDESQLRFIKEQDEMIKDRKIESHKTKIRKANTDKDGFVIGSSKTNRMRFSNEFSQRRQSSINSPNPAEEYKEYPSSEERRIEVATESDISIKDMQMPTSNGFTQSVRSRIASNFVPISLNQKMIFNDSSDEDSDSAKDKKKFK